MDDSMRDALETLEFLVSSPVRPRIVAALADGPMAGRRLQERLEVPRSTLHRNLSALVDRGFVSRSASAAEYELTPTGETVNEAVSDALTAVERAQSIRPFLEYFPAELPTTSESVAAAEVVVSDVEAPFDPIATVESQIVDGETVRGFLPVINPLYVDALRRSAETDVSVDVIAPPSSYERVERNHHDAFEAIVEQPSIRLYESDSVPQYAIGFVDDTVLLGAFDEHMRTQSVLRADSRTPIWDWAANRYAELEPTADRFDTDR